MLFIINNVVFYPLTTLFRGCSNLRQIIIIIISITEVGTKCLTIFASKRLKIGSQIKSFVEINFD